MINFDLEKKSVDKIEVEILGINNCVIKNVCVCLHAYKHTCKYRAEEVFGAVEELFFIFSPCSFLIHIELDLKIKN